MIKNGEKVKYRSTVLKIDRLYHCDLGENVSAKIFKEAIGEVVEICPNSHWSPLDIKIKFSFGTFLIPANFFSVIYKIKKGHRLTDMFKPDKEIKLPPLPPRNSFKDKLALVGEKIIW